MMSSHHKDEDDDSYNSDELNDMLENMDIDNDFNIWSSFRCSVVSKRSPSSIALETSFEDSGTADSAKLEMEDIQKWSRRLLRVEIYSKHYKPSAEERKELDELEQFLGMGGRRSFRDLLFRRKSDSSIKSSADGNWNRLIHPEQPNQPASILLKRGPVLWKQEDDLESECELILMTHGLVIASVAGGGDSSSSSSRRSKVILRVFEQAIMWNQVGHVTPLMEETSFAVVLKEGDELVFDCATSKQQEAWLEALERVLVQSHMHSSSIGDIGWQYQLIYKPGFTAAVCGKYNKMPPKHKINQLDSYNHFSALHYAVRSQQAETVVALLQAGADPNTLDGDERTPMFYAVNDEAPRLIIQTLESFGATAVTPDRNSELFGRVEATQQKLEHQREVKRLEEQRKAEAAQAQMAENMRLLQQRGEKINELGDKATQLNEGAQNFAEMAQQLKEKSKKQSSWFGL